jgi:hypothetical protein
MPQHPRYTNSPSRNLDKLYELLNQLVEFGILHEEIYNNIDSIMVDLYPTAFKKYAADERGEEFSDDENKKEDDESVEFDNFIAQPSVSSLFEYIAFEEEEQFIQDLRNTIAHCMFSGTWSTDGASAQILELRDIEYYKMHTYLEEDTATNIKYRYSKRTVWFPSDAIPVRIGIYEISDLDYQSPKHSGYAYWNGKKWFDSKILLKDCMDQKRTKENEKSWGSYCWRGFLEQQPD